MGSGGNSCLLGGYHLEEGIEVTLSLQAGRRYRITAEIPVVFGTGSALEFLRRHCSEVKVIEHHAVGDHVALTVEAIPRQATGRIEVPFVKGCRECP